MQDPDNLSALYRFAIKEDQGQKIRELDFGKSSSQASAQCDVNAIKGSGCYKCGSNDHFIKGCPLNREKDRDLTHGQQKHYNDYRSKSHDENSMEKSIQAITDLLKSLLKQNKPSHTTMNRSTHRHSYTKKTHSDHKPSYKHPTTDLTNQTIRDTTIRANIGTIQESMSLVNVPVMPLVALTYLIWRRSLINRNLR